MTRFERIDAATLPVVKTPAVSKSEETALAVAKHKGAWCKVFFYPYTPSGMNSANVRAYRVKRTKSWQRVGVFDTSVRADLDHEPARYVVWARCVERRYKNGKTERYISTDLDEVLSVQTQAH